MKCASAINEQELTHNEYGPVCFIVSGSERIYTFRTILSALPIYWQP